MSKLELNTTKIDASKLVYIDGLIYHEDDLKPKKEVEKMNIPELKWVVNNKHLLDEVDYDALESFDLFNQYENGELKQNSLAMLELVSLVGYIYEKYSG